MNKSFLIPGVSCGFALAFFANSIFACVPMPSAIFMVIAMFGTSILMFWLGYSFKLYCGKNR